jgi:hypothetical protein
MVPSLVSLKQFAIAVLAIAIASVGCTRRNSKAAVLAPPPVDFLELRAGSTVQVVIPLTRSGSYVLPSIRQHKANDFDIKVDDDFLGYEKVLYKVKSREHGGVQIQFTQANDWERGKTSNAKEARLKLFEDLADFRLIRLVYLTRESQADHNMAIVASNDMDALRASTNSVTQTAECRSDANTVCRWVPEGVAVTVEKPR